MLYYTKIYNCLKNVFLEMFLKDMAKFIFSWVTLAFLPFFASVLFDFFTYFLTDMGAYYLEIFLIITIPIFISLFAAFLFISLWVAFKSKVPFYAKIFLIMLTYLLIWLSFGNLFYFFSTVNNFTDLKELLLIHPASVVQSMLSTMPSATISPLQPFWRLSIIDEQLFRIVATNRMENYFDCLYFSGVNILTIGFGDIVPVSRFTKALVLLECFLGMLINVLAVGIWLSDIKKDND